MCAYTMAATMPTPIFCTTLRKKVCSPLCTKRSGGKILQRERNMSLFIFNHQNVNVLLLLLTSLGLVLRKTNNLTKEMGLSWDRGSERDCNHQTILHSSPLHPSLLRYYNTCTCIIICIYSNRNFIIFLSCPHKKT